MFWNQLKFWLRCFETYWKMLSYRCYEHRLGPRAESQHLHFRGKLPIYCNIHCSTSIFKSAFCFVILSEGRICLIFEPPLSGNFELCLTFSYYNKSTHSSTFKKPSSRNYLRMCWFSSKIGTLTMHLKLVKFFHVHMSSCLKEKF